MNGQREEEYRGLVDQFVKWRGVNHLQLNVSKMKEIVVDFGRKKSAPSPVFTSGSDVEIVSSYKYLGMLLVDKLEWLSTRRSLQKTS